MDTRLLRIGMTVAALSLLFAAPAGPATATPSPSQMSSAFLTPAEVAKATGTVPSRIIMGPGTCEQVCEVELDTRGLVTVTRPARYRIEYVGDADYAKQSVQQNAQFANGGRTLVSNATTFVYWSQRSGYGMAQLTQARGPWLIVANCNAKTPSLATQCVGAIARAQYRKLKRSGISSG